MLKYYAVLICSSIITIATLALPCGSRITPAVEGRTGDGPLGWNDNADLRDTNRCGRPERSDKRSLRSKLSHVGTCYGGTKDTEDSKNKAWPWQALLLSLETSFMCDGSLIAPDLVLAAAHCYRAPEHSTDSIGVQDIILMGLNRGHRTHNEQQFEQKRTIVGLAYSRQYKYLADHDYMIYRVEPAFVLNDLVQLVCLAGLVGMTRLQLTQAILAQQLQCVTSGYGAQKVSTPNSLLNHTFNVQQATMRRVTCASEFTLGCMTGECLCATDSQKVSNPCMALNKDMYVHNDDDKRVHNRGDSGGPLMCRQREIDRWTLSKMFKTTIVVTVTLLVIDSIVLQCRTQWFHTINITDVTIGQRGYSVKGWKDTFMSDIKHCGQVSADYSPQRSRHQRVRTPKTYSNRVDGSDRVCRRRLPSDSYIIGGREATAAEWPWQALLKSFRTGWACGGTLIAPDLVLAAAHCFLPERKSNLSIGLGDYVYMGRSDRALTREDPSEQRRQIVALSYAQQYSTMSEVIAHDYIVYRVFPPFELTRRVNLVCLADFVGMNRLLLTYKMWKRQVRCVTTGFGVQKAGKDNGYDDDWPMLGPLPNAYKLQQADVIRVPCAPDFTIYCIRGGCVCVSGVNGERPCMIPASNLPDNNQCGYSSVEGARPVTSRYQLRTLPLQRQQSPYNASYCNRRDSYIDNYDLSAEHYVDGDDVQSSATNSSMYIINGMVALPKAWPWQVYLERRRSLTRSSCGGSIIAPDLVLSAAHCFKDAGIDLGNLVWAGRRTSLTGIYRENSEQRRKIVALSYSSDFSFGSQDLIVYRVDQPFQFNEFVQPICLAGYNSAWTAQQIAQALSAGTMRCVITGFGQQYAGRTRPLPSPVPGQYVPREYVLHEAEVRLTRCTIEPAYSCPVVGCLCFTGLRAGTTCYGDSGGPVACYQSNVNRWTLVGVTSFGVQNCESSQAAYMDVSRLIRTIFALIDDVRRKKI
ncbi:Chymotrypsinogen B [Fragariocoptes setiger]|uniref:Chymotrypsinogen B n=1 Tax=Fragariocoptes setiger TaxID=1670756 RepID=A0ABQ7SCK8_9ACAR|nr:Chymotrypsinogen B [Fragariocoptes setiger]